MGSFNIVCGVTGLPIHYNDKVVAIPMLADKKQEMDFKDFPVWTHFHYNICGLPMAGTYNDYGKIQFEKGPELDLYKQMVNKISSLVDDDDDDDGTPDVYSCWGNEISLFVMHQSVYDYLKNWVWLETWDDKFMYDGLLERGKEKYDSYAEVIASDTISFHSYRDMNRGFVTYYYKNPFYYILRDDTSDSADNFEMEYFIKCFPIVEASGALNFKLDPPMYGGQSEDIEGVSKIKNELFTIVKENAESCNNSDYDEEDEE